MFTVADRVGLMMDGNVIRIKGVVVATLPDRGFFWIRGDDGEKYFAHQAKVRGAYSIYDMWEGQECTFVAKSDDPRGLRAEQILMKVDRA